MAEEDIVRKTALAASSLLAEKIKVNDKKGGRLVPFAVCPVCGTHKRFGKTGESTPRLVKTKKAEAFYKYAAYVLFKADKDKVIEKISDVIGDELDKLKKVKGELAGVIKDLSKEVIECISKGNVSGNELFLSIYSKADELYEQIDADKREKYLKAAAKFFKSAIVVRSKNKCNISDWFVREVYEHLSYEDIDYYMNVSNLRFRDSCCEPEDVCNCFQVFPDAKDVFVMSLRVNLGNPSIGRVMSFLRFLREASLVVGLASCLSGGAEEVSEKRRKVEEIGKEEEEGGSFIGEFDNAEDLETSVKKLLEEMIASEEENEDIEEIKEKNKEALAKGDAGFVEVMKLTLQDIYDLTHIIFSDKTVRIDGGNYVRLLEAVIHLSCKSGITLCEGSYENYISSQAKGIRVAWKLFLINLKRAYRNAVRFINEFKNFESTIDDVLKKA